MNQCRDQWIEERKEKYRCPYCGKVIGCSDNGTLGIYSFKLFKLHLFKCAFKRNLSSKS